MSNTSNIIGDPGENLAALRLAKFGVFKTYFLGEKAPSADFLIEIIDADKPYHAWFRLKVLDKKSDTVTQDGWLLLCRNKNCQPYIKEFYQHMSPVLIL